MVGFGSFFKEVAKGCGLGFGLCCWVVLEDLDRDVVS